VLPLELECVLELVLVLVLVLVLTELVLLDEPVLVPLVLLEVPPLDVEDVELVACVPDVEVGVVVPLDCPVLDDAAREPLQATSIRLAISPASCSRIVPPESSPIVGTCIGRLVLCPLHPDTFARRESHPF
jgi:hypothetical protein